MARDRKGLIFAVLVVVSLFAAAAPVMAKGNPHKPPSTTTTTQPQAAPSCYERVREMGATGWAYDPVTEADTQWDGSGYVQTGIPACIDVDQPGHTGPVTWQVTWGGGATARPIRGIKLVFEAGVHGTVYAEQTSDLATCDTSNDCAWTVTIDPAGLEPLVLVAMPRSGDKWTAPPTFTVTPIAP